MRWVVAGDLLDPWLGGRAGARQAVAEALAQRPAGGVVSLEAKPSSPARAPRVATEYPKAGIIVAGPIASGFSVAYPDRA